MKHQPAQVFLQRCNRSFQCFGNLISKTLQNTGFVCLLVLFDFFFFNEAVNLYAVMQFYVTGTLIFLAFKKACGIFHYIRIISDTDYWRLALGDLFFRFLVEFNKVWLLETSHSFSLKLYFLKCNYLNTWFLWFLPISWYTYSFWKVMVETSEAISKKYYINAKW